MYCPNCGCVNNDHATACGRCQQATPFSQPPRPPQVPNHLGSAVFTMLCCCLPTGIVATVYAAQSNQKLEQGDYLGAITRANIAHIWVWVSFGLGILGIFARAFGHR